MKTGFSPFFLYKIFIDFSQNLQFQIEYFKRKDLILIALFKEANYCNKLLMKLD